MLLIVGSALESPCVLLFGIESTMKEWKLSRSSDAMKLKRCFKFMVWCCSTKTKTGSVNLKGFAYETRADFPRKKPPSHWRSDIGEASKNNIRPPQQVQLRALSWANSSERVPKSHWTCQIDYEAAYWVEIPLFFVSSSWAFSSLRVLHVKWNGWLIFKTPLILGH